MTCSLFCMLENVVRRLHWFVHHGNPSYWVFSFGRMCGGGLVSAPQIISATSLGNPSLTESVTTPLRQNAVAWVDQNNHLPSPCAISQTSPYHLPCRFVFSAHSLGLCLLYGSQTKPDQKIWQKSYSWSFFCRKHCRGEISIPFMNER